MKYNQVKYDMITAFNEGVREHPQKQMEKLGYKVIASIAQSLYDCWGFTVEDYIEPMPKYLKKFEYDFDYWHGEIK